MGCCTAAVVHIVRRPWYNGYGGRGIMGTTAVVQRVWRPPYHVPIVDNVKA